MAHIQAFQNNSATSDQKICLKKNNYPGKLIVFEGTDGAGKTTMIRLSEAYLKQRFSDNLFFTKQPTDLSRKTKLFQKMIYCGSHDEIDYRAVQLLTLSDRVQHNHEVIEPALQEGKIVICDRYLFTSVANMLSRGYRDEKWFFEACKGIVRPDLTFLAHSGPDLAIARIKARPEETKRHLNEPLLRSVSAEFLRMSALEDMIVLDTSQNQTRAFETVKQHLDQLLGDTL